MDRHARRRKRIISERIRWDKLAGPGWYNAYRRARKKALWLTKPKHFNESKRRANLAD